MPPTPLQILSNPPQNSPSLHPQHGPWLSQGLLPYLASIASGAIPATVRYVSAVPGNVAATGSEGDPFNPTSAAGLFAGDPFAQAAASMPAPTSAPEVRQAALIFVGGGNYPNPATLANVPSYQSTAYLALGFVDLPIGSVARLVPAVLPFGVLGPAVLAVTYGAEVGDRGQAWTIRGPLQIDDGGLGGDGLAILAAVSLAGPGNAIEEVAPPLGAVGLSLSYMQTTRPIVAPTCRLDSPSACHFDALTVQGLAGVPDRCEFSGAVAFTVDVPSFVSASSFRNVGPKTWTAPAGGAPFDRDTAASFGNTGWALFGGSSIADYFAPDVVTVGAVFDCVPGAPVVVQLAVPQNRTVVGCSFKCAVPPGGAGAVPTTVTMRGNSIIAAPPFDLTTLPPGINTLPGLSAVPADLDGGTNDLIEITITAPLGTVGGQDVCVSINLARGTFPL